MKRVTAGAVLVMIMALFVIGCKKETETLDSASIQDYFPLQVGRTFIYRMDSTVIFGFGTSLVTHSYHAKDSIQAIFTDNLGRPSYRIFRYIRDTTGTKSWVFSNTFAATYADQTMEYVENNLRFVKLHLPIKENYSWYGHAYIDTHTDATRFLDKTNGWDYTYTNVGDPYKVLDSTYSNTVTVAQNDETSPPGPFNPASFQERTYGQEVYAKGVGLVYKEFLYWTWQTTPNGHYQDDSRGIKLRLISYK